MAHFVLTLSFTTRKEDNMSTAFEVALVVVAVVLPFTTLITLGLIWPSGEPPAN